MSKSERGHIGARLEKLRLADNQMKSAGGFRLHAQHVRDCSDSLALHQHFTVSVLDKLVIVVALLRSHCVQGV